jgi:hypothetical protein
LHPVARNSGGTAGIRKNTRPEYLKFVFWIFRTGFLFSHMNKFESISTKARDWRETIIGEEFKRNIEEFGLARSAEMLLDSVNAKLHFEKEGDESFSEIRNKLNNEAGVVIANHPGNFDLLCILAAINRKDLKFMVNVDTQETWSKLFGEKLVVPSLHMYESREEAEEAKKREKKEKLSDEEVAKRQKIVQENLVIVRSILDHIKNGGLFIYFPTGGDDSRHMEQFKFENLFRLLVGKMKSTDMVYSFNILNPEKRRTKMDQALRTAGSFSSAKKSGNINISRLTEPISINVDEDYSQAGEWKSFLKGDKEGDSEALTEHYLEKFPRFDSIIEEARRTRITEND